MSSPTFDKAHLSKSQMEQSGTFRKKNAINCTALSNPDRGAFTASAINCTRSATEHTQEGIDELVRQSLSDNTRRAYASDLRRFEVWGGALPASSEAIAAYVSVHAQSHSCATILRWLASLSKAHRAVQQHDPTKTELVKSVLKGIRRRHGTPPKQALPLTRDLLFDVLEAIPEDLRGARDKALLLVGFAGGFRRSELVGLCVSDCAYQEKGLLLTLRRSKTDQTGRGRVIGVPFGRGRFCPVKALRNWLEAANVDDGPVFRSVDRNECVSQKALSGHAVSLLIKRRLAKAGIECSDYSGHSLRSGFVTSAARAGVSSWKIRQQTGHASDAMLQRYIRDTEVFQDNAAGALL